MKTEYVVGLLFKPSRDSVVLIEKNRPAWQKGKLNGVGGKLESGENPLDAMAREFKEETGADIPADQWQYFLTLEGGDWRVYCYRAFGQPVIRSCTDEEVAWTPLTTQNVPCYPYRHLIPNLNWIIPMALDTDRICGAITYMDEKFMQTVKETVPKP